MTMDTEYSDHKAFVVTLGVDEKIIPVGGNIRLVTDVKDREKKNLIFIEKLINDQHNEKMIDTLEDYNENL